MSLPATAPSAARSRALAFAGLLLGGALGLVAGSQAWWRASGGGTSVSFTGNQASGGLTWALAAVLLAGALLGLVLRARGRRVIAVVLALTGLGLAVTGLLRQQPTSQGVLDRLAQVTLADSFALAPTAWPWIYALAGLAGTAGALTMLLRAGRWPVRTARFDRAAAGAPTELADDPASAWKAMDAGEDPTAIDPEPAEPSEMSAADGSPHPDVQSDPTGDTMDPQGGTDTRREPS
ncbi:Trp biosynthesis-associated membrane protein [Microlunatus ginsengisoli]|uniref:Tryptophan-associated transmembrane protein (Trp_oprn_chp) n=1 Tax=Microlunatus ginsengisoli TaxID=363863 RepID=A0ABP6ZMK3_9ACTN